MFKKNIGKPVIVFSVLALLTLSLLSFAFADKEREAPYSAVMAPGPVADEENKDVRSVATEIGTALGSALSDESDVAEIAGVIMGEEIGVRELQVRAVLYEYSGNANPLLAAWNSYKVTIYEKKFAEEHDLIPTDAEIWEFTQQMKEQAYSAPDGGMYAETLLEAAGMTSDEYWNDYKIKFETPAQLINANIARYVRENGLTWPTDDEITNASIIKAWGIIPFPMFYISLVRF
jgi:hypothetical protein